MPVAKSSSKTPLVVLLVVLVLAAVGVGAWFLVNRSLGNPSVEDLVELMPADATAVVLVRGLPKLALDFRLEEHFETLERENEDFRQALEEMRAELGFDPTDREAMDEQGFDLLAPLGVVFTLNPDQSWNVAGFLPVSDPEKVDAAIRRHAEQAGEPVRDVEIDGSTFAATGDGRAQYAFHERYLVVSGAETETAASTYLARIVGEGGGGLGGAAWWTSLQPLLGRDWKLFAGVNPDLPESLLDELEGMQEMGGAFSANMEQLRQLASMGVAVELTTDLLRMDSLVTAREDAHPLDATIGPAQDTLVAVMPGEALAAMRLSIDPEKALAQAVEETPEIQPMLEQGYASLQEMTGVDFETAVVPYLGSPISLAVVRDEGQVPVGGALWLPLEAGHQVEPALASAFDLLSQSGLPAARATDGALGYALDLGTTRLRWGVARDHLVVAAGQNTAADVSQALAEPGESFLQAIERSEVRRGLESEGDFYVYLDLPRITSVVEQVVGADNVPAEARPVLDHLGVLYGGGDYEPRSGTGYMVLHAADPDGFAKALDEAVAASVAGGQEGEEAAPAP